MDVVGNAFNSNTPAELPVAREQLLPLIQQSKKGPAIDLDAFLLAMLEQHLQGEHCCQLPAMLLMIITGDTLYSCVLVFTC